MPIWNPGMFECSCSYYCYIPTRHWFEIPNHSSVTGPEHSPNVPDNVLCCLLPSPLPFKLFRPEKLPVLLRHCSTEPNECENVRHASQTTANTQHYLVYISTENITLWIRTKNITLLKNSLDFTSKIMWYSPHINNWIFFVIIIQLAKKFSYPQKVHMCTLRTSSIITEYQQVR